MRRRFISNKAMQYVTSMYMEAVYDTIEVSLPNFDVEYRIGEDGDWTTLVAGEYTPVIQKGTKIYFKKESRGNLGSFVVNGNFALGGDCRSLLYGEKATKHSALPPFSFIGLFKKTPVVTVSKDFLPATTLAESCYGNMFHGCISLVNAPELPATTLADSCYDSMFYGCSSLITAPELSATTLYYGCYSNMFDSCSSLTIAPDLPATTLASRCYMGMFYKCSKLNYIKMFATDISAYNCLDGWVYDVSSTGTFVKNPAMTSLPTGKNGIPSGWTVKNDGE